MSVLIKGMEMPHSCVGCRFCEHGSINEWDLYCGIDNKHIGNWDDKHINNGWRRPDCPLVEAPTPHGRLIDAADLLKTIAENAYLVKHGYNEIEYGMTCFGIMQAISEQPTIIEAEEGEAHD